MLEEKLISLFVNKTDLVSQIQTGFYLKMMPPDKHSADILHLDISSLCSVVTMHVLTVKSSL